MDEAVDEDQRRSLARAVAAPKQSACQADSVAVPGAAVLAPLSF
jgi:hypothetical protein